MFKMSLQKLFKILLCHYFNQKEIKIEGEMYCPRFNFKISVITTRKHRNSKNDWRDSCEIKVAGVDSCATNRK